MSHKFLSVLGYPHHCCPSYRVRAGWSNPHGYLMLLMGIFFCYTGNPPPELSSDPPLSFVNLIPAGGHAGTVTPSPTPLSLVPTSVAGTPTTVSIPPSHPFMLASSFLPIPAKLVAKIKSLEHWPMYAPRDV